MLLSHSSDHPLSPAPEMLDDPCQSADCNTHTHRQRERERKPCASSRYMLYSSACAMTRITQEREREREREGRAYTDDIPFPPLCNSTPKAHPALDYPLISRLIVALQGQSVPVERVVEKQKRKKERKERREGKKQVCQAARWLDADNTLMPLRRRRDRQGQGMQAL